MFLYQSAVTFSWNPTTTFFVLPSDFFLLCDIVWNFLIFMVGIFFPIVFIVTSHDWLTYNSIRSYLIIDNYLRRPQQYVFVSLGMSPNSVILTSVLVQRPLHQLKWLFSLTSSFSWRVIKELEDLIDDVEVKFVLILICESLGFFFDSQIIQISVKVLIFEDPRCVHNSSR